jgi:NADPH-dependent 2,4-dienoyl-CoA reductase/sulfur reductase-like enzyme/rhodanese-related sulfurtransferase
MNSAPSAPAPRRILIVGGVAGGASAATRARRTNEHAEIVVFEKDAYVSFANCGLPYHIGGTIAERDKLIVATPERFRERFRIDVRTRHEVLAIDRARKRVRVRDHAAARDYEAAYDKLILAPGASPIVPDVPGVKSRGVFTLRNLDDMDRIVAAVPQARTVAVVGAGFIGLEVAEQLRERGLAVTLIEKAGQVLPLLDPELAEPLRRELLRAGVEVIVGTGFQAIDAADGIATGVVLEDGRRIPADLVVLGLGVRPNVKLAVDAGLELGKSGGIDTDAYQRTSDPDIYAVGDAAEYTLGAGGRGRVPLAGIANRTGRLAGQHAATDASAQAPGAWGTAIVKVFGLTAGITGDSLRAARRRGLDARAVHVTGNHHAGYYPGASPLTLALVYEVPSGRILGAEAIGAAGVDKRLDVIATLLHSRGSVHDLAQLDLAYAPPFGAAKDPLHIAAFAAENDLDGLAPLVAPGDDLGGSQVVDVREPAERQQLPLAGVAAMHTIPLDRLRARVGELDQTKPVVVSCQTGLRAHVATRYLRELGFDARNLSGGALVRDYALQRPSRVATTATSSAPGSAGGAKGSAGASPCPAPIAACGAMPNALASGDGEAELATDAVAAATANGALLLDVRAPAEFRSGHVQGAVNLPLDRLDAAAVRALLPAGAEPAVLLLCASGSRARSAASRLAGSGLRCQVVRGGLQGCRQAGLPMTAADGGVIAIERQVRIAAGVLVLLGALLALTIHPGFVGVAAFVGAGLMVAGITDWCGMGLLLARAPWNR